MAGTGTGTGAGTDTGAGSGCGPRGIDGVAKSLDEAVHDVPALEDTMGPDKCPYPTASYESLLGAFSKGIVLRVFVHTEKALANLVAVHTRDFPRKTVVVFFPDRRSLHNFSKDFVACVACMNLDLEVVYGGLDANEFVVSGNTSCNLVCACSPYTRGVGGNTFFILSFDGVPESHRGTFFEDIVVPLCGMKEVAVHHMQQKFDEGYERRKAKWVQENPSKMRWGNVQTLSLATLKITSDSDGRAFLKSFVPSSNGTDDATP